MIVLSPIGFLGYGIPIASLKNAAQRNLDVIAVDGGSTDAGPYYLGSGRSLTSRTMVKRDLGLLMDVAAEKKIPLIIGTAGTAGGIPHLEWTVEIAREIADEHNLSFRLAKIQGELDKGWVKRKLSEGAVEIFETEKPLEVQDIDRSVRIVAQMGFEPIVRALDLGADMVIAGRALDAALFAALPVKRGFDIGLAFHMGKIIECGAKIALPMTADSILAYLRTDHFVLEAPDPHKRCTASLTAAHTFYEESNPVRLPQPGGMLDLTDAQFEQIDDKRVKVWGSRYIPSQVYRIKIEGAAFAGYRAITIAGVRDPIMIRRIDEVIERSQQKVREALRDSAGETDYQIRYHVYGRDGVMGDLEPVKEFHGHELGLVIQVVARTQDLANAVCALARSASLHCSYEGRLANAGNLAFPFSPSDFPVGEVYEFSAYHLVRVDDPCEPFPIDIEEI